MNFELFLHVREVVLDSLYKISADLLGFTHSTVSKLLAIFNSENMYDAMIKLTHEENVSLHDNYHDVHELNAYIQDIQHCRYKN